MMPFLAHCKWRWILISLIVWGTLFAAGCSSNGKIKNYPKDIRELKEQFVRLDAFPEEIPENAGTPYYSLSGKGFGQGAFILRLSYKLPSSQIDKTTERLEREFPESTPRKVNRFLFGRFPLAPYEDSQMIPDDFRVFLVGTELNTIKESPNHNQLCAIAVSKEQSYIAYLFDSW